MCMTLRFSILAARPGDLTDSLVHVVLCDSVKTQKGFGICVLQYPNWCPFLGYFQYDIQYRDIGQGPGPGSHRSIQDR